MIGRISVLWLLFLLACGDSSLGPSETVSEFAQVMERSKSTPGALRDAYALLDSRAQAGLAERAQKAATLAGRDFEPWEMLARGRLRLRFSRAPVGGLRERIDGDRAQVVVTGQRPGERAEIPLVREQGRWRIQLELPPLRSPPAGSGPGTPAQARPGGADLGEGELEAEP